MEALEMAIAALVLPMCPFEKAIAALVLPICPLQKSAWKPPLVLVVSKEVDRVVIYQWQFLAYAADGTEVEAMVLPMAPRRFSASS